MGTYWSENQDGEMRKYSYERVDGRVSEIKEVFFTQAELDPLNILWARKCKWTDAERDMFQATRAQRVYKLVSPSMFAALDDDYSYSDYGRFVEKCIGGFVYQCPTIDWDAYNG